MDTTDCRESYDRVADEYARRIFDELRHKPLDCRLLDRFAARVRNVGPVCDMGYGPGHVARYLYERGVEVCGVDLAPQMVDRARRLNPGVAFRQGDMMALDVPDGTWAGIAAFYSIIHIPREEIERCLRELRRVLRPGGVLLLAFHAGDETLHLDEWWGQQVCVDFFFFRSGEVAGWLASAGFEIEEIIERDPYPEVEHQSRRCYIFARSGRPKWSGTRSLRKFVRRERSMPADSTSICRRSAGTCEKSNRQAAVRPHLTHHGSQVAPNGHLGCPSDQRSSNTA